MVRYACASSLILASLLVGCSPKTGPTTKPVVSGTKNPIQPPLHLTPSTEHDDPVIATAGSTKVHRSELLKPLKEGYGLGILMHVIQRNLAIDAARELGLEVSDSDVEEERDWTLKQSFPKAETTEDREKLLDQLLNQPKPRETMMTRAEFDIMMHTNAAMRKIAERSFKDSISEEQLKEQFDRQYGASVKVRFIMLSNMQEVQKVQRMIAAGQDFAEIARSESRDAQTRALGGELPPFTANDQRLPEAFRDVAFSLKENQVSDAIQAGGSYHLLKVEKKIDPKAIRYEDVKDNLRESIRNQMVINSFKDLRAALAQQALATLEIDDPILRRAFESKLAERDQLIRDKDKIKQEIEKQRNTAVPDTSPSTEPAPATRATQPTTKATKEAATMPVGKTANQPPTSQP